MKYLYYCIVVLILLDGCSSNTTNKPDKVDKTKHYLENQHILDFKEDILDLGVLTNKDEKDIYENFYFKNISKEPVLITKAEVSCGCISIKAPKGPIMPDSSGTIKARINLTNIKGGVYKQIFLRTNIDEYVYLIRIKGFIED